MSQVLLGTRELPLLIPEKLKGMAMEKNLKPGDHLLSEGELAVMFGMGRSTMRKAVKLLIIDNAAEIHRGRGTFITESPGLKSDPSGLYFANPNKLPQNPLGSKPLIEPQIARLAAQRATSKNFYRLGQAIEEMETTERISRFEYPSRDVDFHTAVAEYTWNDVLKRILPLICESIREGYLETTNVPGTHQRVIVTYARIFKTVWDKNPDVAAGEARWYVLQAMDDSQFKYQEE